MLEKTAHFAGNYLWKHRSHLQNCHFDLKIDLLQAEMKRELKRMDRLQAWKKSWNPLCIQSTSTLRSLVGSGWKQPGPNKNNPANDRFNASWFCCDCRSAKADNPTDRLAANGRTLDIPVNTAQNPSRPSVVEIACGCMPSPIAFHRNYSSEPIIRRRTQKTVRL